MSHKESSLWLRRCRDFVDLPLGLLSLPLLHDLKHCQEAKSDGTFFLAKKRRAKSRFQEKVMVPVGRSTSKSAAVALPSLISAAAFTNLWDRFCLETDGAQT